MTSDGDMRARADPVLRKIDAIRRSVVYWAIGWGLLWVALVATVLIFCGVLADHALVLQRWGRLVFFRALALCLGAGLLAAMLFPVLKRIGRLYVARRMEATRPELKNSLISYLQCRDDPGTPGELKRMMRRKAGRLIRSLDIHVVVEEARYVRVGVALCLVVLLFLVYAAASPKSAAVSLRRLLSPRAQIHPPTGTRLAGIEPGEIYVISGRQPRLKVRIEGVRPQSVYAVWNGTTFADRRILLTEREGGRWEGGFPPILEPGGYHVVAGDTRSDRFGITVLPQPAVERLELALTPPAYTGLPVRTVSDGNVQVVTGTVIAVRAATNLPPRIGHLQ
ncbi:MAG: hypothetical protein ACYS8K_04700, partial [Planctomycetota bacterium]